MNARQQAAPYPNPIRTCIPTSNPKLNRNRNHHHKPNPNPSPNLKP